MSRLHAHRSRSGLSLLEVLIALAVLLVGVAAAGQLSAVALRAVGHAEFHSRAALICESQLARLVVERKQQIPASWSRLQEEHGWEWRYRRSEMKSTGMILLRVEVRLQEEPWRVLEMSRLVRSTVLDNGGTQ